MSEQENGKANGVEKSNEKDHLDEAIERFKKIKAEVGAENVKSFLESMSAKTSPLRADKEKDEPTDAEKADDMRKELEKGHNREFTDRSQYDLGLPTKPDGFGAQYTEHEWKMDKINNVDNPALLDNNAWNVIVSANKILHGFVFNKNNALSRARFPAFQLRKEKEDDGKPHFEIFDDSSISIKETVTQSEAAMAANGFSSNAIAASISGGAFGFSAAASASYDSASQQGKSSSDFQDRREYMAVYNFPRARVFVDEHDLTLTERCQADVMEIRQLAEKIDANAPQADLVDAAQAMIQKFLTKYGSIFATKFLLGGQLTASKSADSIAGTSDTTKRDEMKWSAAASFSSTYVSGSVSGGQEKSSNETMHKSNVNNSSALAWNARGGNTLLSANPAEWANSVASYKSWRTMEQDDILWIPHLISKIPGAFNPADKPRLDHIFNDIQGYRYRAPIVRQEGPITWSGKFKLQATDGSFVKWDGKRLVLSEDRDEENAMIFRAADANIYNKQDVPSMLPLRADWPIFLPTHTNGTKVSRDKDFGNQVPGVFVDKDGYLLREVSSTASGDVLLPKEQRNICRWSLQMADENREILKTPMSPNPQREIQDGTKVTLACHSYYCGSYRSPPDAPWLAPTAHIGTDPHSDTYRALRIPKITNADLASTKMTVNIGNIPLTFDMFQRTEATEVLFKEEKELMRMVQSFDKQMERAEDTKALDNLRKLFAARNPDVAREFVLSTARMLDYVYPFYQDNDAWAKTYAAIISDKLQSVVTSWKRTEKFADEAEFHVRYVA